MPKLNPSVYMPLSVWTLIFLSACQTVPNTLDHPQANHQLNLSQPYQTFDYETISDSQLPSIASESWQDFYHDDNLKQLIALALENNKDVQATILAIQKAKAQYQIIDGNDALKIGTSAGVDVSGNFKNQSKENYQVGLALSSYEFDFWGKIANAKAAALSDYLATTAAKDTAQISLISQIAQQYVAYSYHLAQLQFAEDTLQNRQQALEINQKRFQAGLDSELSSVQAEQAVENVKIAIANSQTALLKTKNALDLLVGKSIEPTLLPKPAIDNLSSQQIFSTGLPSELLRYRPDIRQAEHQLAKAGANIQVAKASFYPNISLTANVGTASAELTDLFKTGSFFWMVKPSINLPIFDGGVRKANLQVSEIVEKQALNQYEKAIQTAFKEVNDVLATRATLNQQLLAQKNLLTANQKNYQIANARFQAGLDNYLGVLDAQRANFTAVQNILQTQQQILLSQIQLYQALGGGVTIQKSTHENSDHKPNLAEQAVTLQQQRYQALMAQNADDTTHHAPQATDPHDITQTDETDE